MFCYLHIYVHTYIVFLYINLLSVLLTFSMWLIFFFWKKYVCTLFFNFYISSIYLFFYTCIISYRVVFAISFFWPHLHTSLYCFGEWGHLSIHVLLPHQIIKKMWLLKCKYSFSLGVCSNLLLFCLFINFVWMFQMKASSILTGFLGLFLIQWYVVLFIYLNTFFSYILSIP